MLDNRSEEENILEKTEMRMLRRIKGVTVKDKMKSEDIRNELGVGSIKSKAGRVGSDGLGMCTVGNKKATSDK